MQNLGDRQRLLWYFPKWPIVAVVCPSGIDPDATRFQCLDAVLDRLAHIANIQTASSVTKRESNSPH